MTAPQATVFLVDDDVVMLFTLRGILQKAGYRVEAYEQPEALLARLSPVDQGCVLMDLQMPGMTGLQLQQELLARSIALPLVFVSGSGDIPHAVAAMKHGAVDFLTKPVNPPELLAIVARALRSDAVSAAQRESQEQAHAHFAALSQSEQEVCRLCARGLSDKEIAAARGTSVSTAQAHRVRAWKKLAVGSLLALIQLFDRMGEPR